MSSDSNVPAHLAQAILTIDLAAIVSNWRLLRDRVAPAQCAAVVKANAYGAGIAPVARALADAGCKTFFVAHVHEALALRRVLPREEYVIYTLNGIAGGREPAIALRDSLLRPVIGTFEELALWRSLSGTSANPALPMALQFSTGMNRLGFAPREAGDVTQVLATVAGPQPDFVMSHFVSSEIPDAPMNSAQIAAFAEICSHFPALAGSLANSSGIFLPPEAYCDLVRPGYALYGGNPTPGLPNPMQPVVQLQAPVLQVRHVQPGETAGYNGVWTAKRPSRLAVIGVGYADGFLRSAGGPSDPGFAMIGGTACPIAGRVSMDLLILDATDAPEKAVHAGARAELLGTAITIDDLAERAGTIGYEILTGLGARYHRRYVSASGTTE
jgi:alanine racemase